MAKIKGSKKLSTLPVSKLNSLYLGKEMVYRFYPGNIIHIAYLGGLDPVPYCEVCLRIWNNKTVTKIMKLSDVVLVSSGKVKVA